ncbi:RHS repeat domain-containing protein [Alishewanella aestuarii]|uniref:RHS repeat domain-containing protein n=1 Tax=Alishewanella aestuarii TaxID=453835 RepID=UPI0005871FFA|nr:RHS repeat-associated core domain-containing protein [Alishewanella aestuarii]
MVYCPARSPCAGHLAFAILQCSSPPPLPSVARAFAGGKIRNLPLFPAHYTGHEQIDDVGLVHMGGRVYDPILGRFLQADPFVQQPNKQLSKAILI